MRPGGLNVPLSSEPSRVGDALSSMVGQLGDQEITCRTSLALQRITSILTAQGSSPAVVFFFSSGLASPESGMRSVLGVGGKLCEVRATDFDEVARNAASRRPCAEYSPEPCRTSPASRLRNSQRCLSVAVSASS
jgi:hypothetical protein